jgi:hypothetical protein
MFVLHADGNIYYLVGTPNGKIMSGRIPKGYGNLLHFSKEIRKAPK